MTVIEFETYLQKGLGRAILLLRQEPDKAPFREAVWNHANEDPLFYDQQCSGPHGHYIKELFDCFPDGAAMLTELFRTYREGIDSPNLTYHVSNLVELTEEGVDGAKESLIYVYEALHYRLLTEPKPEPNEYGFCVDNIRDLYSNAVIHIRRLDVLSLDRLVRDAITLLKKGDRYDMSDFSDIFGRGAEEQKTEDVFASLIEEDPENEKVYTAYREHQAMFAQRKKEAMEALPPSPTNWREAVDFSLAVRHGPMFPVRPILWRFLSREDAAEIARQVEEETDTLRRTTLMTQLSRYGSEMLKHYPRDPSPLINELKAMESLSFYANAEKEQQVRALSRLISKMRHPVVREFALDAFPRFLENPNSVVLHFALKTWITNYRDEDEKRLLSLITPLEDDELLHDIGLVISRWEEAPATLLRLLYDKTPCSSCRHMLAHHLLSKNEADEALLAELPHDCEASARRLPTLEWSARTINNIEFFATDLHFLGDTEEERQSDLCVHGKATLRVNGHTFADGLECCLTASALRFLRTLNRNHLVGKEEFLFPCCGNMLIPSEDGKTVTILGCTNGTEFSISHVGNNVVLDMEEGVLTSLSYEAYREAVKAYATSILVFLKDSPPRRFANEFDEKGYEAFLTEYQDLLAL